MGWQFGRADDLAEHRLRIARLHIPRPHQGRKGYPMSMTVAALHKRLSALIAAGHGRKPVLVNKASFTHPLEMEGAVMLDIAAIYGPTWIPMADDDGGTKWNKDGTESGKTVVLLSGGDPAGDFAEVATDSSAVPSGVPPCRTCGGSGVVDDGEITGVGGAEFLSGPIKCMDTCPTCKGARGVRENSNV
jgi:hypothetical protein